MRGESPNDRGENIEQTQANHKAQAEETRRGTNQIKGKGKGRQPTPTQSTTNGQQQIDLDEAIAMFMRDDPSLELANVPSPGSGGGYPQRPAKPNSVV